ncbi:MAG TPA: PilZ domain-containing protein [Bdellovibrio sp.]
MSSVNSEQAIFKKVAISEKKMLFRELASDKAQIAVKGALSDDIFHLIVVQVEKDETLLCHHTEESQKLTVAQPVVINFPFKSDRYFLQSEVYFESGWVVLKIDTDLFQLQRRANARLDIPEKYPASFIISQHDGANYFVESRLKDISAGGFKMEYFGDQPAVQVGDLLKGTLRIGIRRPLEFSVEVRFVQKTEAEGVIRQVCGVQFKNVTHLMENRLLSLMMDLHRELFLKFS